ncbi:MAG: PilZ domain-containing protein [Nitrospinota bacterium]
MAQERRNFSRIDFDTPARLFLDKHRYDCILVDISLKGALLSFEEMPDFKEEEILDLEVDLSSGEQGVTIKMNVSLAHVRELRAGFYCKNIDIESISHLRRLMELNLGDIELVNREIADLGSGNLHSREKR